MNTEMTLREWSVGSPRVKWSAVFAGWVVGLAAQMILTLLGLAVGAWAVDLRETQPADGVPLGTGIWTGISMLISAFVGGFITARLSGSYLKSDGLYHGVVVWGVNWLIFAWLTTTAMGYLAGGLFSALGTTVQAMSRGVGEAASAVASQTSGGIDISTDQLRNQIESVMQATGKSELQPGEVKKDAGRLKADANSGQSPEQIAQTALADLQQKLAALDRDAAINVMVNKLGMTDAQARQLVQSTIGIAEPLKQKAQEVKHQSLEAGTTAINRMGTIAMWLCGLAVITLGLSMTGGMIGAARERIVETHGTSYPAEVHHPGARAATR
jgi:hypothetical protein